MRAPLFDLEVLAALLRPPGQGYLSLIERARQEAAPISPDAARHFLLFAGRVGELDEAELEELYRESFGPTEAVALRHAADQMRVSPCAACASALPEVERLLAPLESARNPFAVLFKAICVLLLTCRARDASC